VGHAPQQTDETITKPNLTGANRDTGRSANQTARVTKPRTLPQPYSDQAKTWRFCPSLSYEDWLPSPVERLEPNHLAGVQLGR
jgi:hypothetical protein